MPGGGKERRGGETSKRFSELSEYDTLRINLDCPASQAAAPKISGGGSRRR